MGAKITTEKGFVDHFIENSIDQDSFLTKVDRLIDWKPFEKHMTKYLKRGPAAAGQPAYPDLAMLKIVLLQFLYNLSDEAASFAVTDRISFLHFVGLPFDSNKPDASTICRFRNSLLKKNIYRHLLELFNKQIETKGLLVKTGIAVDATLIASCRHPRKVIDIESAPKDRQEHEKTTDNPEQPTKQSSAKVSYSDDTDATWTIKGGKPSYGFKAHAAADLRHGFILGGHVTGANVADTSELAQVVDEINAPKDAIIATDKGYTSQKNSDMLKQRNLRDGIMKKAQKNKPLNIFQKYINSMISKHRWKIERSFGTLKKVQGASRARYLGKLKVELEFHLQALAHNVRKAVNLAF